MDNKPKQKERFMFSELNSTLIEFWKEHGNPDRGLKIKLLERMVHWYKDMEVVAIDAKDIPTEEEITKQLEEMDKEREIAEGEKRYLYGKELYEFGKKLMESQEDTPESIKKVIEKHWWDML